MNRLVDIATATRLVSERKHILFVAGSRKALQALPRGPWVGGTTPYFMDPEGGVCDQERVFVHVLPDWIPPEIDVSMVDASQLQDAYLGIPRNGFGLLVLPGFSEVLRRFALEAPDYPGFATSPLIGWVSGVHLDALGEERPLVFDGTSGEVSEGKGVLARIALPKGCYAEIGIVNLFRQGEGAEIRFLEEGFHAKRALVDGKDVDFGAWCVAQGLDLRLPLVADYGGARINVSFRALHPDRVDFYAPVFPGVAYRQALPVEDYALELSRHPPVKGASFSCNCILNYLFGKLEGKVLPPPGPATFGEIAYQLLNQTQAYLRIERFPS